MSGVHPRDVHRPIVAFDFDGTLTVRDSYTAFLRWSVGPVRYALGAVRLAPDFAAYLGGRDRGLLKAAATRVYLRGLLGATLREQAQVFAAAHFESLIRPDALACWNGWASQEPRRVIVTASPESIVVPFAERLGADELIGTRLAFDREGRVTGRFAGPNCRGEQKVARLREIYGPDVRVVAAYGDTSGDREMLALAEQPGFRVFSGRPARA